MEMVSLTDNQIDEIYDVLINRGISLERLRDELLDHICCLIEGQMNDGTQFHLALDQAEKQFGPEGLEKTQEATIYLTTLKIKQLKKTASLLGIIGGVTTIFGTLFKVMHWPYAGILLLLGLGITALFFMPTALYVNYITKEGIKDKLTVIAGFTGGILLTVFAVFKVMHWPGATIILFISLAEIILLFIPLYYIKSYRNPDNKWFDIGSLTVILASVIMVLTLYSADSANTQYINGITYKERMTIKGYNQIITSIQQKTNALKNENSSYTLKSTQIEGANSLLSQSFYQYRNYLLNKENALDYSLYNKTLLEQEKRNDPSSDAWNNYKNSLAKLNEFRSMTQLADVVKQHGLYLQSLSIDASQIDQMLAIAQSIQNLPKTEQLSFENDLLQINYLNMIELHSRNIQLSLLES